MIKRTLLFLFLLPLFLLLPGTLLVIAQENSPVATTNQEEITEIKEKIETLENKLYLLQKKDENLDSKIKTSLDTIESLAGKSIAVSDSSVSKVTWMLGIPTVTITLIAIVLAIVGIREIRDIQKLKEQFAEGLEDIENTKTNIRAWLNINKVRTLSREPYNAFEQGLEVISEILDSRPTDKYVLSVAYSWKGYIIKRKNLYKAAFDAAEKAIKLEPEDPICTFNAACYAALLKDYKNLKKYIELTAKLGGDDWIKIIRNEYEKNQNGDFKEYYDSSEFKELLDSL